MEQKFNKGDLVELPNGTRLLVVSVDAGDSENNDVNYWLSTTFETGGLVFVSEEDLTLVQAAKEYIEVNGHKVPKPLSVTEVESLEENSFIYIPEFSADDGAMEYWASEVTDDQVKSGVVFGELEDAIAMSKALLSAIPKQ